MCRLTICILLTATLLWPAPGIAASAGGICGSDDDLAAFGARALQTDLMVSALVCDRRESYNTFVRTHRAALTHYGVTVRSWFVRRYGRTGELELNRFVTRLANEASRASNANRALYCRATSTLFEGLAVADAPALAALVRGPLLAVRHGIPACDATAGSLLNARP